MSEFWILERCEGGRVWSNVLISGVTSPRKLFNGLNSESLAHAWNWEREQTQIVCKSVLQRVSSDGARSSFTMYYFLPMQSSLEARKDAGFSKAEKRCQVWEFSFHSKQVDEPLANFLSSDLICITAAGEQIVRCPMKWLMYKLVHSQWNSSR